MNKPEAAAGVLVIAIGGALLFHASKLAYMIEKVPGPGFLPLWLSFGLLVTGLILTIKAVRPALASVEPIDWPKPAGWRQIAVMLGALAIALLVLELLGFLFTAMLFMAAMVYSLGLRTWPMLTAVPVLGAVVLHFVFAVWLGVPLPQGVLAIFQ
jgi:putative tricarboxylic transport membrane protein